MTPVATDVSPESKSVTRTSKSFGPGSAGRGGESTRVVVREVGSGRRDAMAGRVSEAQAAWLRVEAGEQRRRRQHDDRAPAASTVMTATRACRPSVASRGIERRRFSAPSPMSTTTRIRP